MKLERVLPTLLLCVLGALLLTPGARGAAKPPSNDDFANATAIVNPTPYVANESTAGATTAADDPSCLGSRSFTVWFRYTPTRNVTVAVNTGGSSYEAYVCAYTGSRGALTQVASGSTEGFSLAVTAGRTYYMMSSACVTGAGCAFPGPGPGTLQLTLIEPLPNDEIEGATTVTEPLPFTATEDLTVATPAPDDPDCSGNGGPTVWFRYTPSKLSRVQVSTAGSDFDTLICVFTGSRGSLTGLSSGGLNTFDFQASPGTSYFLMLTPCVIPDSDCAPWDQIPGKSTLHLQVASLPPPSNDDIANAITATEPLPFTSDVDTSGATSPPSDPQCVAPPNQANTVWYRYTPSSDTTVNAGSLGSAYLPVVCVYTSTGTRLTNVASNPGSVTFSAKRNTTYLILVASCDYCNAVAFGSGKLHFTLQRVSPPPNDDIGRATVVTQPLPFTSTETTLDATTSPTDPTDCPSRQQSVWYQYTPSSTLTVNLNTVGSDYDTDLCVYSGSPSRLTQAAVNEGTDGITLSVTGGTTYWILVSTCDYCGSGGGGHLSLVIQKALQVSLAVEPLAIVDSHGNATLTLDVTCSRASTVRIGLVEVGQQISQPALGDTSGQTFTCPGQANISVTLTSQAAPFVPGPASVFAATIFCSSGECVGAETQTTVQLAKSH